MAGFAALSKDDNAYRSDIALLAVLHFHQAINFLKDFTAIRTKYLQLCFSVGWSIVYLLTLTLCTFKRSVLEKNKDHLHCCSCTRLAMSYNKFYSLYLKPKVPRQVLELDSVANMYM